MFSLLLFFVDKQTSKGKNDSERNTQDRKWHIKHKHVYFDKREPSEEKTSSKWVKVGRKMMFEFFLLVLNITTMARPLFQFSLSFILLYFFFLFLSLNKENLRVCFREGKYLKTVRHKEEVFHILELTSGLNKQQFSTKKTKTSNEKERENKVQFCLSWKCSTISELVRISFSLFLFHSFPFSLPRKKIWREKWMYSAA